MNLFLICPGKISHIANIESDTEKLEEAMRQILGNETSSNMDSSGEDSENNQVKKSFGCKQAFEVTNIGADVQKYKNTDRKTY